MPDFNFSKDRKKTSLPQNKETENSAHDQSDKQAARVPAGSDSKETALQRLRMQQDDAQPDGEILHTEPCIHTTPASTTFDAMTTSAAPDVSSSFPLADAKKRSIRTNNSKNISRLLILPLLLLCCAVIVYSQQRNIVRFVDQFSSLFAHKHASNIPSSGTTDKQHPRVLETPSIQSADSLHDWNYYLQVSSWSKLKDAERVAKQFREKGVAVKVQCVFLQSKHAVVYRVRCGPFASFSTTRTFHTSNAAILPDDAFIDSMRSEQDPSAIKTVSTLMLPTRGFGIQISSFNQSFSAKKRALELAEQYAVPVFLNVQQVHMTPWYRVFVGPFQTRGDAQRQTQFLSAFLNHPLQETDLSKEK